MTKSKLLTISLCSLALTACAGLTSKDNVEALRHAKTTGSDFTAYLATAYGDFSTYEQYEMYDYVSAKHFALKGLQAAKGLEVSPEHPSDWKLPATYTSELTQAYNNLLNYFNQGSRQVAPWESAMAQSRFDCWVEQQTENWQTQDIAVCKNDFINAMALLKKAMNPKSIAEHERTNAKFMIFFDFNQAKITKNSNEILSNIVAKIRRENPKKVFVVGHTDTTGKSSYNMFLSDKRASNTKKALIKYGVSAKIISTFARGEKDLLVKTPKGVNEPANRRSEIKF